VATPAYNTVRPRHAGEGIHIVDNFIGNDLVTDNNIGQFKWQLTAIANTGTFAYLDPSDRPGGLRHTTDATADGDGDVLQSDTDGINFPASTGGGGFAFAFRYPDVNSNALAGNNFRIGVDSSVTAAAPTDGISVLGDAGVLTLRSDSADHGDTSQAATSVSTLTSGTTAVLDVVHFVVVQWSGENGQGGPNLVECFVDNEKAASVYSVIDNDETAELKIAHWQDTGGTADLEFDILFYEYWQFYDLPTAEAV